MPTNPVYTEQATKLVLVLKNVIKEAQSNDGLTMIFGLLGAIAPSAVIFQYIASLPQSEKDEFFAEVFDAAVGNEPGVLLNHVGFFEAELLEQATDLMKDAFVAYMNRELEAATVAADASVPPVPVKKA